MITLTVTTLDDEAAGTTVATVEAVDGSGLSLREAVTVGAAYDDASVEIVFAPRLAGGTIELEQGPLAIAPGTASGYDLAIHGDPLGDGAGDITIFGGTQAYTAARIVDVAAGTNLALDDLRIEGAGPAWADGIDYPDVGYLAGIGIAAGAVVEISDAEILNGWFTQAYGEGGGIHNAGTLTLRDVDIAGLGLGGGAGRSVDLGPVERAYMAHELVIDGKGYRLRTFGEGGDEGSATVAPGGAGVTLEAGARKEVSTFKLTAGTVLSFDFAATGEGDLHAIGFDTAGPMDPDNVFQLLGTQTWGNQWAAGEASADGAVTHFEIPVGALVDPDLVGEFVDLVFITDDAAMGGADTTFADISLRQASAAEVDLLLC